MSFKNLIDALQKGGPGSGIKGHKTERLAEKLKNTNAFGHHLEKLESSSFLEGVKLRSEKPVFNSVDQAAAHSYTPEEYREASSVHYKKAQDMANVVQQVKDAGRKPHPEMEKIVQFHRMRFKQFLNAADKRENRAKETDEALKYLKQQSKEGVNKSEIIEKARAARVSPHQYDRCVRNMIEDGVSVGLAYARCTDKFKGCNTCACGKCPSIEKSIVMMDAQSGTEIDTSKFSVERQNSLNNYWLEYMTNIMNGYQYGELPRTILLDRGDLQLVKVDDGLYTGFFKHVDGGLEDNAKVRIERMTLPSLVQFCMAKEWIGLPKNDPVPVQNLIAKLEAPANIPAPIVESPMDKKIRVLELISKLVS